jgi:hypothetical protein
MAHQDTVTDLELVAGSAAGIGFSGNSPFRDDVCCRQWGCEMTRLRKGACPQDVRPVIGKIACRCDPPIKARA